MLKKYINASNCITFVRIIGSVVLIFLTAFSPEFYIIYSVCGVSDAVDGSVARKCNTTSEFGARLDSVADIVFYAVMLIKKYKASPETAAQDTGAPLNKVLEAMSSTVTL